MGCSPHLSRCPASPTTWGVRPMSRGSRRATLSADRRAPVHPRSQKHEAGEIPMSSGTSDNHSTALVSTGWVAEHLADPKVRIFEVDVDTAAYERGHLVGAVGINWSTQLSDPIRRDIPTRDAWDRLLGDVGVTRDTRIVFY